MTKAIVRLSGCLLLLSLTFLSLSAKSSPEVSCGTTISTFPYTESFETGLGAWSNSGPNNLWTRDAGGTPSNTTGPSSGYLDTYYVYTEASGSGSPSKEANLVGPCFDLGTAQTASFQFAYHMDGSTMGNLSLQISNDGGSTWASLWSRDHEQGSQWQLATVSLDAFVSQTVKLRFHAVTGTNWASDMAIDYLNLSINSSPSSLSCSSTVNSFPYTESFEFGSNSWNQEIGSTTWVWDANGTGSSATGPSSADDGTYYYYIEASSPNYPDKVARISSPCFDLSQLSEASFGFSYHMYGSSMGNLKLQIATDTDPTWQTIWSRTGDMGDQWFKTSVDLSAYLGKTIKLQFEGTTGNGFRSDMAIDNIKLETTAVQYAAGCTSTINNFPYFEGFETGWGGWEEQVAMTSWIRRFGSTPSSNTGPSSAYSGSYYMYSEGDLAAFSYNQNKTYLRSPCFDLGNAVSAQINFNYHLYYNTTDSLHAAIGLQISTNQGNTWTSVWSVSGNQGNTWHLAQIDISSFVGQTIQLRVYSEHDGTNKNDLAIDNVQLFAPETSLAGSIQASIEFPQTTTCSSTAENYCCGPETLTGLPVPNVGIDMMGVNGNTINVVSNGTGTFAEDLPGGAVTLSPFVNTSDWSNGISLTDVIAVANHANGSKLINCPLQRLAADVDNDGDIDSDDSNLISNMNSGSITVFPGDNWRFIPKSLVMPNDLHPDNRFIADFWNSAKVDGTGDQYPFKAKLGDVDGIVYDYNGSASWLNNLQSFLNTNCNTTDFGFYIVKAGDINGSAVYNGFSAPYGPPAAQSSQTMAVNDPNQARANEMLQQDQSTLRSGKDKKNKYLIKIVAEATEPIVGYQLALTFDDEHVSLDKINPNKEQLNQSLEKNFGEAKKTLRGGSFVTQWVTDFEQKPDGENFSRLTLLSADFKSDLSLIEVESAFQIDSAVKEILFLDKDGNIVDVDLQVIVSETK